ncbi:hypothetical protein L9F63_002994 [Diploptera punctata]|uniref:AAA+ ATPase domain-containing protein n=1 Tax=Diploptera punctata TaxID=6984 RepID=A0AAD7ZRB6_DIPPU|nr:hypothetical protein L9F63_002994 [Diploptera punctata]
MVQTTNQLEWHHRLLVETAIKEDTSPGPNPLVAIYPRYEPPDANKLVRQKVIESTRQIPTTAGLNSVAGLADSKEILQEAVYLPLKFPHLFTGGLQPSNKILLYGPPGTGKTHLVNAFAAEMNIPLYSITSTDLLSTWLGESEKLIRELFEYTREQAEYCFIFIDEVDSICRQRTARDTEVTRRMKNELLAQMNACNSNTFLLCATNCPWDIDSAFLRRFQRRIYIPLPGKNDRRDIIKLCLQDTRHELSDSDWAQLLDLTDGFSGSDLANLTSCALLKPIRELANSTHWIVNDKNQLTPCTPLCANAMKCNVHSLPHDKVVARPMNFTDIMLALQTCHRSVNRDDIVKFENFTARFG